MVYEVLSILGLSIAKGNREHVVEFLSQQPDKEKLTVVPDHQYDQEVSAMDFLNDEFWKFHMIDKHGS